MDKEIKTFRGFPLDEKGCVQGAYPSFSFVVESTIKKITEQENEYVMKTFRNMHIDPDVLMKQKAEIDRLSQELEKEKLLNAEIKKRLVEVEYDCEEFNHEYCDPNCNGKRKETIDLLQLVSDGLNETLLKQKDEEIKRLEKENMQLKQQKKTMKECYFNGCLGCTNKDCEVKK